MTKNTTKDDKKIAKNDDDKSKPDLGPKIRIKIRAYDNKIIDIATKTIIDTAERNEAKIVGPVPLPTEIKKYSVNRSTFVHKPSQEQYEIRTHKRIIDIYNAGPKAVDALMNLNLPSGVDIEIKMS
ncbi:MAG: 30S ribosomal protein S10 [Candidatus Magasanikbacteria bacterium CG_4_10_14_0_2_um_filter_37_12]|uniref:Small ribosomal subunit protein uS10 n=1 Tax=Candidatus Magasanikbacteria bacterium CG_4_10_14_0_2_um_filter_37_12 TaxID=1974637 RepID=A0A2M7V8L1_9BACT|nr:MAG: 30S ribosomal protein S10 [Candidatus Magasanikbacteria bacterium CG_4_10_14_0_2_um_filter_37_12]